MAEDRVVRIDYTMEVSAFVNLTTQEVERVVEWGGSFRPLNEGVECDADEASLDAETLAQAYEIAEDSDWPGREGEG